MHGIKNYGKEFMVDYIFGNETGVSSFTVGLYRDATDDLGEDSDVGNITTEPTGASYSRQSVSFGTNFTNSFDGADWQTVFDDVTFDLSDSNQTVDSVFVVVNFDSDHASDGGTATDHIFATYSLAQTIDASGVGGTKTIENITFTQGG